jgi:iron-sulfur cluster insertion protein
MSETATATTVAITEAAARRVEQLIKMDGNPNKKLRLGVSGGGCSGFQYGISLDDAVNDDDVILEQHGVKVVVDQTSLDLLSGSVLDFVSDLMGASFQVKNPNATSTCGCGSSFSM